MHTAHEATAQAAASAQKPPRRSLKGDGTGASGRPLALLGSNATVNDYRAKARVLRAREFELERSLKALTRYSAGPQMAP